MEVSKDNVGFSDDALTELEPILNTGVGSDDFNPTGEDGGAVIDVEPLVSSVLITAVEKGVIAVDGILEAELSLLEEETEISGILKCTCLSDL